MQLIYIAHIQRLYAFYNVVHEKLIKNYAQKKYSNLAAKNFDKKKCLKFRLNNSFQIVARCYVNGQLVPDFWSRDSECPHPISHLIIISMSIDKITTEVNAWDNDE